MAVQAPHHTFLPSQQHILTTGNLMNSGQQNTYMYNPHLVGAAPGVMLENQIPMTQCNSTQMFINSQGGGGVANNLSNASRKRARDLTNLLGNQFSHQMQQQLFEIETVLSQNTKKIRLEIQKRERQQQKVILSIGQRAMDRLKERDEQIQRMEKFNLFLQEKVKNLMVENQIWKNMVQANEATATTLQRSLDQVLARVSEEKFTVAQADDDAESCNGSTSPGMEEKMATVRMLAAAVVGGNGGGRRGGGDRRMCRKCGDKESGVLLLPCRHLCLCTVCGTSALIHSCPVCNASTNATVHVNMS